MAAEASAILLAGMLAVTFVLRVTGVLAPLVLLAELLLAAVGGRS